MKKQLLNVAMGAMMAAGAARAADAITPSDLGLGDIVRHRDGGPEMTVDTLDGFTATALCRIAGVAAPVPMPLDQLVLVRRATQHPDMGGVKFSGFAIKHEPAGAGINFDSDEPIPEGKACSIVDPTCESCQ